MTPFVAARLCPGVRGPVPRPANEARVVVGWAETWAEQESRAGAGF